MQNRSRSPGKAVRAERNPAALQYPLAAIAAHIQPCPKGFIYTVLPGDTFFSIADRLNLPFSDLVEANPQVLDPSRIEPGHQLCIPHVPPPLIGPIGLYDSSGQPLMQIGDAIQLTTNTVVRVPLFRASQLYILLAPLSGHEHVETKLIGTSYIHKEADTIGFLWTVPRNTKGSLYVIACNNRSCLASEPITVMLTPETSGV